MSVRRSLAVLALGLIATHADADEAGVRRLYDRCEGCHSPDRNRTGPMLGGLFGHSAGSIRDFDYSAAMASLTFQWNDQTLSRFLENPQAVAPGNKMEFRGIDNAAERRELIEYLHRMLERR
ncbi:MAG: cytochrome c family protein [Alphaproteobacteria bacterium]|nr:cytochrome c family protein [Alphaproteobacteria bacterium]